MIPLRPRNLRSKWRKLALQIWRLHPEWTPGQVARRIVESGAAGKLSGTGLHYSVGYVAKVIGAGRPAQRKASVVSTYAPPGWHRLVVPAGPQVREASASLVSALRNARSAADSSHEASVYHRELPDGSQEFLLCPEASRISAQLLQNFTIERTGPPASLQGYRDVLS
jgi:hypothetical protein